MIKIKKLIYRTEKIERDPLTKGILSKSRYFIRCACFKGR